ncbi:MAG: hypothetical protein EA389_03295 [Ilumatobacter sp.]|nr:MAG: hypothetical protein EA389_03295 [Ilumatobacter sp.]
MPGNPLTDQNWASDIADTIVRVVGRVRDLTTDNVVLVTRAIVYGLLGAILGIAALVLFIIVLTRGLQSLLELAVSWERAVYLSYFVLGGICVAAGALMMTKRRSADA